MLDTLIGNKTMRENLQKLIKEGRLPHSILICGEKGIGKNYAARCIAADYLYKDGGDGAKRVMNGASEECITLSTEGAADVIKVSTVRETRSKVNTTALMTDGRVVIIRDASRMQPAAANALLKVLEEPPKGVVFILVADSEASVLPTVRSRCAVYTMSRVSSEECQKVLLDKKIDKDNAVLLEAIYGGAIGS